MANTPKQCSSKEHCIHPEAKDGWLPATEQYFKVERSRGNRLTAKCRVCSNRDRRNYAEANRERVREQNRITARKYRANNKEKQRQYMERWRKENPEKCRANVQNRRARKRNLPVRFGVRDWKRALRFFDYRCAVCGQHHAVDAPLVQDHWIPLSSSVCPGTVAENIIPLCAQCNRKKHAHNPWRWLKEVFSESEALRIEMLVDSYIDWIRSKR